MNERKTRRSEDDRIAEKLAQIEKAKEAIAKLRRQKVERIAREREQRFLECGAIIESESGLELDEGTARVLAMLLVDLKAGGQEGAALEAEAERVRGLRATSPEAGGDGATPVSDESDLEGIDGDVLGPEGMD